MAVRSYGPDIDLGDMTFNRSHDKPLDNEQRLTEIVSRSNVLVRSYGPDTGLRYMCTFTLI